LSPKARFLTKSSIGRQNKLRNGLKNHHGSFKDTESAPPSVPTVSIKQVNARSQLPGVQIEVTVAYSCPQSNPSCVYRFVANVESANPNIIFETSQTFSPSACTAGICSIPVNVELYVPLNVSVEMQNSSGGVLATSVWSYPVVVDPHVVPQTLWSLYNMGTNPLVTNMGATQAVVEFEDQYYSPADLQKFFVLMGLPRNAEVIEVGPNEPENPGAEAVRAL
jgi:hypothetical protein